jgi:hypothetical protein
MEYLIIIFGILIIGFFILSLILEDSDWRRFSIFLLLLSSLAFSNFYGDSLYKKGQTDALKGKYKYEMKISYEKRLEFSIQDSIVVDSNGTRLGIDENGNYKTFYYQCYFPDTVWETLYIPIDTQFVKK